MIKKTERQVLKMLLDKIDKAAEYGGKYVIETDDVTAIREVLKQTFNPEKYICLQCGGFKH